MPGKSKKKKEDKSFISKLATMFTNPLRAKAEKKSGGESLAKRINFGGKRKKDKKGK